jgi:hypothetical protein
LCDELLDEGFIESLKESDIYRLCMSS